MPTAKEVKLFFQSNAILGQTARARQLDRYEAFYSTTQYQHQTMDWWGLSADQVETVSTATQVPAGFTQPAMEMNVRQKRPTAPYHLCVAGGQRIVLGDGSVVAIEGFRGGLVSTVDEARRTASALATPAVRTKREWIREISLRNGRMVRTTHDHKIMSATANGFGWNRAEDLQVGDYVAAPRIIATAGRTDEVSIADAALAGYIAGDGSAISGVVFINTNREIVEKVRELADACGLHFGWTDGLSYTLCGPWKHSARSAVKRSRSAAAWAERVGLYGCRAWNKRAPVELFRAAADRIQAFIGGLWDTDGCIRKDVSQAVLTTTSRGLAEDTQDLLLRIGILSSIVFAGIIPVTNRPKYNLNISGASFVRFAECVTLSHPKKQARLLTHLGELRARNERNADYSDVIPSAWRVLAEHGHETRRDRAVSRSTLRAFGEAEASTKLLELANADVQWIKVAAIADKPEEDVYDISVPDTEAFIAENVVVHNCKAVVDRFTGLLFGEARRPDIEVEGDPDTDDYLHACMEQMRWWPKWREARTMGGSTGSVLVTWHLKGGGFQMLVHNPKHVQILWKDRRALEPLAALVMYTFPKEEVTRDAKTGEARLEVVEYLYRRLITHEDDTVYKEAKLSGDVPWDEQECTRHELGRFPGVWIQNKPVTENEDGEPDCHGLWQTFDTIDRLIAQMNKAVLCNCDPTLVVKVDAKEKLAMGGSIKMGSDNAINVGASGDAKFLEITAAGVKAAAELVGQLKQQALDVCRCVLLDPETISGAAQSAKAIEYIMSPMLEQGDDLRAQWGDMGLIPGLKIVEEMARAWDGRKVQFKGADGSDQVGIAKLTALPKKADGTPRVLGPGGWIRLRWGAYFKPSEQDKEVSVRTLLSAKQGGAIDHGTLVNQAAPIFGVKDSAKMLEAIKAEEQEEVERMMGGAIPNIPPDIGDDAPPANIAPEPSATNAPKIELTPSMQGAIITVNQALAQLGLPNWPDGDGDLTIAEFQTKHSGVIAAAANAEDGTA